MVLPSLRSTDLKGKFIVSYVIVATTTVLSEDFLRIGGKSEGGRAKQKRYLEKIIPLVMPLAHHFNHGLRNLSQVGERRGGLNVQWRLA